MNNTIDRRTFLKTSVILGCGGLVSACTRVEAAAPQPWPVPPPAFKAQVAFVKTTDRAVGVKKAIDLLNLSEIKGKNLFLKPNFNSADAAPGSTHPDTLSTLVQALQSGGAERITVGDRSGMGDTRGVMDQKEIFRMADELNFETLVFDELTDNDWVLQETPGSHLATGLLSGHWQVQFPALNHKPGSPVPVQPGSYC